MAADETLTTVNAAVQAAPTAETKLSPVEGTPMTRLEVDTHVIATGDTLEVGDKIRIRKVQGGSKIIPRNSHIVDGTSATALTLDVGIYEVAPDGSLGAEVDKDILADGVNFVGSNYTARPYDVPITQTEYWIVAEVMAVSGSPVATEWVDFVTAINSAN